MIREARLPVLVLGAAACGGRAKPATRPAPAPATSSASTAAANPTPVPSDTIPRVAIAIPDSVLTKQVVAVFGDSVVPVTDDSAVVEGPTWDIDVRSYEAHRGVEFYVNAFGGSSRERFIA